MSSLLFNMYKDLKKLEKACMENIDEGVSGAKSRLDEIMLSIETLEAGNNNLKEIYERNVSMQQSFSPEQIDFICYQIGEWYLEWKNRIIIDLEQGTHKLGYAKEQLKTMICGE